MTTDNIGEGLIELLPCPFCGGPAVNVGNDYATCGAVRSGDCPGRLVCVCITSWNTRALATLNQPVEGAGG